MADAMDIAQQCEQAERERLINNARSRIAAPSRFTCEVCDAPIPEARRIAIPGRGLLRDLPANRRAQI